MVSFFRPDVELLPKTPSVKRRGRRKRPATRSDSDVDQVDHPTKRLRYVYLDNQYSPFDFYKCPEKSSLESSFQIKNNIFFSVYIDIWSELSDKNLLGPI